MISLERVIYLLIFFSLKDCVASLTSPNHIRKRKMIYALQVTFSFSNHNIVNHFSSSPSRSFLFRDSDEQSKITHYYPLSFFNPPFIFLNSSVPPYLSLDILPLPSLLLSPSLSLSPSSLLIHPSTPPPSHIWDFNQMNKIG